MPLCFSVVFRNGDHDTSITVIDWADSGEIERPRDRFNRGKERLKVLGGGGGEGRRGARREGDREMVKGTERDGDG